MVEPGEGGGGEVSTTYRNKQNPLCQLAIVFWQTAFLLPLGVGMFPGSNNDAVSTLVRQERLGAKALLVHCRH